MEFEEYQREVKDKYLDAAYGLWGALLTVNGILLAVFSGIYIVRPSINQYFIIAIFAACMCSSGMLVLNYLMRNHTYYRIFKLLTEKRKLTDKEMERDHKDALRRERVTRFNENASLILFAVEILCIAGVLMTL